MDRINPLTPGQVEAKGWVIDTTYDPSDVIEVEDNLTSHSSTNALSANMGRVVNESVLERIKLTSDTPQRIDSDLVLPNNRFLFLERLDGAHENGLSLGVYPDADFAEQYEQEEAFSMADPTCINHNAVASNGRVVGNNVIVNYRDTDGVSQADSLAYLSNVASVQSNLDTVATEVEANSTSIQGIEAQLAEQASELTDHEDRIAYIEEHPGIVEYTGDLSATGSTLRFSIGTLNVLIARQDTTTVTVRLTSPTDIVVPISHRYSGNNTSETLRESFTVTAVGVEIASVTVGQFVLAEFWVRYGGLRYHLTAGSDDNALSSAWVEVESARTGTPE